jgi:branched-subunit amino acid aminotransferase/4-amino-4-deoxychorismate lyase
MAFWWRSYFDRGKLSDTGIVDEADEQVGTMNLFIALKTPEGGVELVTAPLGDLVLPGVTRDRYAARDRDKCSADL